MPFAALIQAEALKALSLLPDKRFQCCVTSPPYWRMRDNGCCDQLGMELLSQDYVDRVTLICREIRRTLRDDATMWLNIADCYNASGGAGGDYNKGGDREGQPKYPGRNDYSLKPKDLAGIPSRVALALQADGWYWRAEVIWHKPNGGNRDSAKDRPRPNHEIILLFSKSQHYVFEHHKQSKKTIWEMPVDKYKGAHFSTFPVELPERCIMASCPTGGAVLDPFCGSGATGVAATNLGCDFYGIDMVQEYILLAARRIVHQGSPDKLKIIK